MVNQRRKNKMYIIAENEVLTISEAALIWQTTSDAIRHSIHRERFTPDEYRKTDRNILVLKSAMIRLYGEPKLKEE
jgi:hypothetical protein